jgi:hypothetical protein
MLNIEQHRSRSRHRQFPLACECIENRVVLSAAAARGSLLGEEAHSREETLIGHHHGIRVIFFHCNRNVSRPGGAPAHTAASPACGSCATTTGR